MNNPNNFLATIVPRPLNEIPPIGLSAGQVIKSRDELEAFVEAPALLACQTLYDKNIRTGSSSANRTNTSRAYIVIDYPSLSDQNKAIGLANGVATTAEGKAVDPGLDPDRISLDVAIDESDTPETISAKLQGLASLFEKQKLLWATAQTLEELMKTYGYEPNEDVSIADFVGEGYYYDPQTKLFHLSEELFHKSQE
jgi:hypothetical protein